MTLSKGSTWDRTNNYAGWRAQRVVDGDGQTFMQRTSGTPTTGERISKACATAALDELNTALIEAQQAGETINVSSAPYTQRNLKGLHVIRIEVGQGRYFVRYLTPADEVRIINSINGTLNAQVAQS